MLAYDRPFLLNLRWTVETVSDSNHGGYKIPDPPFLSMLPSEIRRLPDCEYHQRKKCNRRLASSCDHSRISYSWSLKRDAVSVYPEQLGSVLSSRSTSPRLRVCRRGVNPRHLRSLDYSPSSEQQQHNPTTYHHQSTHQETDSTKVRMALLNVRSISNKTFAINEHILSDKLDLLFMTETWLNAGELGPLCEVCPTDYNFFNTTRLVGRGGGLATIFRNNLKCRLLASELFSSFEVQLFQMEGCNPLLCILVYRPPKYNKDFISEFSDFLSSVVPNADRLLILGRF